MAEYNKIEKKVNFIEEREKLLTPFKTLIGEENFSKFQTIKNSFINDAKSKEDENRLLRIGIIGQIKRGKSSFLNALLFDGKDILPKGATPMTAALTKIVYAKKPYAELEFYSKNDWDSIITKAKEAEEKKNNEDFDGEIPEEEKACLEIYTKAQKGNILSKLGEIQKIDNVERIEDLLNKLEDYVGADGIYTPIVKSMKLGVNIESIKDVEIVDTPGTNDPVVSRGRVTQEFIGQCDVVFFLSLSSQFLDQNDMELFAQHIPKKGIENIFLVGSLFDSAMLDTYNDYKDVAELIGNLKNKYEVRAKEDIDKLESSRSDDKIKSILQSALPPIFISGMCYNIAKNMTDLSEEEQHTLNNLNGMYDGEDFSKDDLEYIANIEGIQEKIDIVTAKKDEILKGAFANVIEGVNKQIAQLNSDIKKSVQEDYNTFIDNDIKSLEKKQKTLQKNMQKGSSRIDNVFESYIIDIEKNFAKLLQDIKSDIKSAANISVENGSKTENYSVVTNSFTNFFNDDWGRETKTRTINYRYANVYDAIEQLEDFVISSEKNISQTVEDIIDIKSFRKDILNSLTGMFDVEDDDFDPTDIIETLKNAVNRISIPSVDIDTSVHIDKIRDSFSSSEVKDSEIDSLKKEIKKVLLLILDDMRDEIKSQTTKIIKNLNNAKATFLPKLLKNSSDKMEVMKENMKDFENTKNSYKELFRIL